MSSEDDVVVARPPNDRAREVRVIRALYPQEFLNHSTKPLNTEPMAVSPAVPRTYQNTGVQTLPPANGDVFRLIHGREPSHNDYARSMGSAGIGRLTNDPRLNPYELVYGSAYHAPTTATKETYTNSGFQTASHDAHRKGLARAKVKASMTTNKYRNAASEAGYVICAESRDVMVVHSEQFPSAVQLDTEGNLLEGDLKSKSLPNIYGALVHLDPSEATVTRKVPVQQTGGRAKQLCYIEHGVQTPYVPCLYPLHSPRIPIKAELLEPATSLSAFAPSAVEQVPNATSVIYNEYGSGEPATDEFVIYDAGAEQNEINVARGSTDPCQGKPNASEDDTYTRSPKKHKPSPQNSPQGPPVSLVSMAVTPPNKLDQNRSDLPLTPDSDLKASSVHSRRYPMQREAFSQACTLDLTEADNTSQTMSESSPSNSIDTSRAREPKSRHKTPRGQSIDDRAIVTGAEVSGPPKARDHNPVSQALNKPETARLTDETLEPTVPSAVPVRKRRGSEAKTSDPASRRLKRQFEEINAAESADRGQDMKRARKVMGGHHHRGSSPLEEYGPRKERGSSTDQNAAAEAYSKEPAPGVATETDRTASGRMKNTSVSRTSRTARRPMTPYVPPAKRLRDQYALESERKKRR
jgi:hypothetical protein